MKKIYAIVLSAALLLVGTQANAQLSIGAGYLNSTLTGKSGNTTLKGEPSNGVYLGGTFNIPIAGELGIAPGLYYSLIAGSGSGTYLAGYASGNVAFTEHAVNVPVYLNYGLDMGTVKLFMFGGPTFQYGLSSTYKVDGSVTIPFFNINLKSGGVIDNYKDRDISPFNIYVGGGLGADLMDMLRVTIGFDYGVLNLYKGNDTDTVYNRYNFKFGVAYLF